MKHLFTLILLIAISSSAQAVYLDFNKNGNPKSNKILKELAQKKRQLFVDKVVSYFHDVDGDGNKEIIGIVKLKHYYNTEGYQLLVLKKDGNKWNKFESDVYFDPTQPFEINGDEITFSKIKFYYGSKQYKARVKKGSIRANSSFGGYFNSKKAKKIEKVTKVIENQDRNEIEITDFDAQTQHKVKIHYSNLDDKTKHYLGN